MDYATPIGQEAQGEAAIYIDGNPEAGIEGSAVPAKAIEPGMRELIHLIRFAGLTPSGTDLEQVRKAIAMLIESATPGLATLLQPGLVMPDGTTISVDTAGRISTRPTMYTCTTAAATAAKKLEISGFALTGGATLHVVFTTVNAAANPTLNVSGTGAKGITYCGVAPEVGQIAKGQVYTLIYSGSQWQIVGGMAPYPIGQYVWFEDELVRPGFKPCNANVVSNFSATYPQMAAYLSTTHGAKRLFASLAEYEAAHNAVWATLADGSQIRWNNIGGAAKFWWDKNADTLLMPDLTGMLREMAGYDALGVGGVHGDSIFRHAHNQTWTNDNISAFKTSKFYVGSVSSVAGALGAYMDITSSVGDGAASESNENVLSTDYYGGSKTAPRAWGALACA